MFTSPFFRRLFLPYLLLICATISVLGLFETRHVRNTYLNRTEQAQRDDARLVADLVLPNLSPVRSPELNAQVRRFGLSLGCRVTIIADDGTVLADNEADPTVMENHRLRPEVVDASTRGEGTSVRTSATVRQDLLYFARRVDLPDARPCYIRLAVHLQQLDRELRVLYARLAVTGALAMVVAGGICYFFARRHSRPLVEITQFAEGLARGELGRRVLRRDKGEVGTLAAMLNTMADSLSALLAQTAKDKAQLLAILSSMSEAVIATDKSQRILLCNESAGRLLDFKTEPARGRLLWEVLRNEPILRAVRGALNGTHKGLLRVGPLGGRHLEVALRPFPSAQAPEGLVIVAHDATKSVRYETLRKEFVANVSHELRTPLTAIKGFTETLQDGAIFDAQKGPQYLSVIQKHADQLTNLVNDLLELSRLENYPELPRCVSVDLGAIVRRVTDTHTPMAQKKRHDLSVDVDPRLPTVWGNPDYLERAISNLVDNAIKYTPEGGRITISARMDTSYAQVEVTDTGIGIPADDLPRIFERFYRVDRSRSREMGGTGLGLSIVKHVAQAHRGEVEVTSTPDAGSTFRLKLPLGSGPA